MPLNKHIPLLFTSGWSALTAVYKLDLSHPKTKVASIIRLTIPGLELCGAQLLAQLVHHV